MAAGCAAEASALSVEVVVAASWFVLTLPERLALGSAAGSAPDWVSSTWRVSMERRGPAWECQWRWRRGSRGMRPGQMSL